MSDPFAPPPDDDDGTALETLAVEPPVAPLPTTHDVVQRVDLPPPTTAGLVKQDARSAAASTGSLIVATPASMMPKPWRSRVAGYAPLVGGTIVSGLLEVALAAIILVDGVLATRAFSVDAVMDAGGIPTHMGGLAAYVMFLFSPLGFAMLALFAEGIARVSHAIAVSEPLGSLPLWAVERAHSAWTARARDRRLGARVVDQVVPDGTRSLVIYSCRPRDWDENTAVEVNGAFWEVADVQTRADSARRYAIHLRPHPQNKPLRRIHHYAIDECLPIRTRMRAVAKS